MSCENFLGKTLNFSEYVLVTFGNNVIKPKGRNNVGMKVLKVYSHLPLAHYTEC